MSNSAPHTPTPWRLDHSHISAWADAPRYGRVFTCDIGHSDWHKAKNSPGLANAAFIVRAVNSHDAMLDVLVDVWFHLSDTTDPTLRKIADNARAVLDKAITTGSKESGAK